MADRNWEAELAKIDKQLASISDEQLMATSAPTAPAAGKGLPSKGAAPARALPAGASVPTATVSGGRVVRPWVSWTKVLVAVGAAAGLMFWPWPAQCGVPLMGFTAATGAVSLLGVWSAIGTWRSRLGFAHLASLLVIVWGMLLGAREVLPRVGYAIPTATHGATWSCPAAPAVAPTDASSPKFPG